MPEEIRPNGYTEIIEALTNIRPGQVIVYHGGHLDEDRGGDNGVGLIAQYAWQIHESGQAVLVQRASAPASAEKPGRYFQYLAIGTARAGNPKPQLKRRHRPRRENLYRNDDLIGALGRLT